MKALIEEQLIAAALEARKNAYAPYSGFKVGAALLTASGQIFSGANVENASYGASICAERVAAVKAVTVGETSFQALVVATAALRPSAPCGICRQFLNEFGPDLKLIMVNLAGARTEATLTEYLPDAFGPASLDN